MSIPNLAKTHKILYLFAAATGRSQKMNARGSDIQIEAEPDEMCDGLFGQVILWVFEILPFLHERGIFPDWKIRAAHYGRMSDGLVIPGVFELAYDPGPVSRRAVNLVRLRGHRHVLGNDWEALSALWHRYFRLPPRIEAAASKVGPLSDAVGIHYRGNDKQTASWDTNPVNYDQYVRIIQQFLRERPEFRKIFLATDDAKFLEFLKRRISLEIINLGGVEFHKKKLGSGASMEAKTDRAILDCVLLSRCRTVLLTSSALPTFAKILNTELEIYRVAASKMFKRNAPYFPVAYIPVYKSSSPDIAKLVDRLMTGDWTQTADPRLFAKPFVSRPFLSPALRAVYLVYFCVRSLPGFNWVSQLPKWVELAYRRRQRIRMR